VIFRLLRGQGTGKALHLEGRNWMEKTWTWSTTGYAFADCTAESICEACRVAGMSGIEGAPPQIEGKTDAEVEAFGEAFRDAGFSIETFHLPFSSEDDISSFYETVRRQAVDKIRDWMHRATQLGATVGIQHPTTTRYDVEVEGLDAYIGRLARSLAVLLPEAEKLGFTIAIENMLPAGGGRFVSKPEHVARLSSEFGSPSFGFCLDTGHALVAAGDPALAAEIQDAMGTRLVAFHLADNDGARDLHIAPGRGLVDWRGVFRRTSEAGYTRAMCIEAGPFAPGPPYTPEHWRTLVAETDALSACALAD